MEQNRVYSVSEVNALVKRLVEQEPQLSQLRVSGEISNCKIHSSGHIYFSLKDESGVLRCVMFRREASTLRFTPENGMNVIAFGRVSVFPRDGSYQLYAELLMPDGAGALAMAFEQLKAKLSKQGLFDPSHKKPLPRFPMRIALVTSPTGAAVRDMLRILNARFPLARVRIYPVRVQGEEAPEEICEGLDFINAYHAADVIITGRGGGSIEDLWAFNDERVAWAVYRSEIPVISAVGHEPDFTICDFVADVRAATPSNAAELAVPDWRELQAALQNGRARLNRSMLHGLDLRRSQVEAFAGRKVLTNPYQVIQDRSMQLVHSLTRMDAAMDRVLSVQRVRFMHLAGKLDALSPLRVLSRGYAVAQDGQGTVVHSVKGLKPGDAISLQFKDGGAKCRVEEVLRNEYESEKNDI